MDDAPTPPNEPEPKKKKKTRGLRSGKDQQKRRRSKAVSERQTAEPVEGNQEDVSVAESRNTQLLASSSRVRLEDQEEAEISDSAFWKDEYKQDGT
jgi:hypothetical protein